MGSRVKTAVKHYWWQVTCQRGSRWLGFRPQPSTSCAVPLVPHREADSYREVGNERVSTVRIVLTRLCGQPNGVPGCKGKFKARAREYLGFERSLRASCHTDAIAQPRLGPGAAKHLRVHQRRQHLCETKSAVEAKLRFGRVASRVFGLLERVPETSQASCRLQVTSTVRMWATSTQRAKQPNLSLHGPASGANRRWRQLINAPTCTRAQGLRICAL